MKFSEKMKKLRLDNRMTRAQLSKILGVSTKSIQMYEEGVNRPREKRMQLLAEALNTTVDFLEDDTLDRPQRHTLDERYLEEIREKYGDHTAESIEKMYYLFSVFFNGSSIPAEEKERLLKMMTESLDVIENFDNVV